MSIFRSQRAVRVYRIVGLLTAVVGVYWILGSMLSGSASAATQPKPANLAEVSQKFITTVQNGGDLGAAVNTARDEAIEVITPQRHNAIASAPAPVRPAQQPAAPATPPEYASVPATNPIERAITSVLPESIPDLFVEHIGDPAASALLTATNGQATKMPKPPTMIDKRAPIAQQLAVIPDLFRVEVITPDMGACGQVSTEAKVACASGIVKDNQDPGQPMPEIHLFHRYGVELTDIDRHAGKLVMCGGYIAPTKMCQQKISISSIVVNGMSGRNSTVGDYVGVIGHETEHGVQERTINQGSEDDKWKFYAATRDSLAMTTAAERDADTGSGVTMQRAVQKGQLTEQDARDYEKALIAAGRAEGNTKDPHATGTERVAYFNAGRVLVQNGGSMKPFEYAM